jgi:hypothetical protein
VPNGLMLLQVDDPLAFLTAVIAANLGELLGFAWHLKWHKADLRAYLSSTGLMSMKNNVAVVPMMAAATLTRSASKKLALSPTRTQSYQGLAAWAAADEHASLMFAAKAAHEDLGEKIALVRYKNEGRVGWLRARSLAC